MCVKTLLKEAVLPLQTHLVFLSQQRGWAVLGAGESAPGCVTAPGRWSRAGGAWHGTHRQQGQRCRAGDKEVHAGATARGPLATLGA